MPGVLAMVTFLLVIAVVILQVVRPIVTPCYRPRVRRLEGGKWQLYEWHWSTFKLGFQWPPLLGVVFLLICQDLSFEDVFQGMAGTENIRPASILILFMSLAYVCVALDMTGVFAYLALRVAQAAGSSGRKLFFAFYCLSGFVAMLTSNDIVVLTLTPVLFYFARLTDIDPVPFLMGEFFSTHIWSSLLYVSNPTNIIVAQAYQFNFVQFTSWTILPTFGAAVTNLVIVWFMFRKDIPETFTRPNIHPGALLHDRQGAYFGSVVLGITLVFLCLAPVIGLQMWALTLASAAVMASRLAYVLLYRKELLFYGGALEGPVHSPIPTSAELHNVELELQPTPTSGLASQIQLSEGEQSEPGSEEEGIPRFPTAADGEGPASGGGGGAVSPDRNRLTMLSAVYGMPWPVVPFVFGMFVLVYALGKGGWTDLLARQLALAIGDSSLRGAMITTFVAIIAANLLNNQPMTILFTEVLLQGSFNTAVSPQALKASTFGLVLASNYGANFTLIGALAGIMWVKLLSDKGLRITYPYFAKTGFIAMVPTVMVACLLLAGVAQVL